MNDYQSALASQQAAALHLYRTVRNHPTPHGCHLLMVCAALLRELTHTRLRGG